jgi:hypothetical protein
MSVTVQSILQEYYEGFAASHPLSAEQRHAAECLRDCRTPAMGGHLLGCPNGHVRKLVCNSCRHKSCPQCGAYAREKWLDAWKQRLIDCPHHHIVFTVDHDLIPLWRYNKKLFANLLFQAGTGSLRELLADEAYLGAEPGMLAAIHTWDNVLLVHPHLHVMCTAGGLDGDGNWREPKRKCLLPRKVLMHKFRGKFRDLLVKALAKDELRLPPDMTEASATSLLNRVGRTTWNVKIFDRYAHGRGVVTYLANYLRGGPIHNGRIIDIQNGKVRLRCRERGEDGAEANRGRRRIVAVPVEEFMARLLEHVAPGQQQTIRPYGLYANSKRSELAVARGHFEQEARPPKSTLGWADFCQRHGIEPAGDCTCPVCGARFELLGSFAAGRDPPAEVAGELERVA